MASKQKLVLCILERDGKYLLPLKERKLGAGRRNGLGGKVESTDASLEDAARREIREEAAVEIVRMERVGELEVTMPKETVELYIFHVTDFTGEPTEQEGQGMKDFQWFDKSALPFELMWPSDQAWYSHFLNGERFRGTMQLDEQGRVLVSDIKPEQGEFKVR